MLMMKRRAGESILIGDDIEIHLAHIGRTRVKIGISAPREIPVIAKEVKLVKEQNQAAAQTDVNGSLSALVSRFLTKQTQRTENKPDERE